MITIRGGPDIRWHDARAIFAGDAGGRVSGVMIHDQDFGAGEKHFQRPTQA
jgi:hypothetical protein